MATPRVCVIIPTLRNAEELEIALGGLSKQTWNGPLEIAIVGPTDDPGQRIAEANGATWIDDQGSRTRADACNVALDVVNCDLVFFTDDDVIFPSNWAFLHRGLKVREGIKKIMVVHFYSTMDRSLL